MEITYKKQMQPALKLIDVPAGQVFRHRAKIREVKAQIKTYTKAYAQASK